MAILFALACLLGLLFLLVKETRITGYVEVTVRTGDVMHMTHLPVHNAQDIDRYRHMVSYAQGLAARGAGAIGDPPADVPPHGSW
jgi:hypothetical protein